MKKIKRLVKKIIEKFMTKEVILYFVFGISTTLINWGLFYILNSKLEWNENLANFLSILVAVLIAYVTNKDLVFHSQAKGVKEKIVEFWKFIIGRIFTMVLEFILGALLFLTPIPKMISKFVVTTIAVILNFFISKFFTFKHKKKDE